MDSADVPIDRLLPHRAWVRALARRLVTDEGDADDLAQDAFVTALERPPAHGSALRAWFARVLRNRAADRRRGDDRRTAREQRAESPRSAVDPAVAVARTEELSRLVGAILELPEPYRTTVVLHYQEECTVSEVAERMCVPVETVRTRVRRALVRLRESLDRAHGGDGREWTLALLPLIRSPLDASSILTKGVTAMTLGSKSKAAVILVLLLAFVGAGVAVISSGDVGNSSGASEFESVTGGDASASGAAGPRGDRPRGRRRDGGAGEGANAADGADAEAGSATATGSAGHGLRDAASGASATAGGDASPSARDHADSGASAETAQTLIVVDDESGAPLGDALAFPVAEIAVQDARAAPAVPRSAPVGTAIHADADGRIALPVHRRPGLAGWYVVAPGHAYATHRHAAGKAADSTVRLVPGGSLRLRIPRWPDLLGAHVFVSSSSAPGFAVTPDPDPTGGLSLEGLPLGKLTVVVRLGDWMFEGEELGRGELEIGRGANDLTVDARPAEVERVRLTGTLRVPANWPGRRFLLIARGEGNSNPSAFATVSIDATPGGPAVSFALEDLPAGPYGLNIKDPSWTTHVEVSAASARIDLEPSSLTELRVRVVDAETGVAVERARVNLAVKLRPNATQPYGIFSMKPDTDTGEHVGTFAQAGKVQVSAPGYASRTVAFEPDASSAARRIDVALSRPAELVVRTRRGEVDEHVPRLRAHVASASGDALDDLMSVFARSATVRFQLAPGTYVVTLEDPLAPAGTATQRQEVEVTRGGAAEIVFDLDSGK